MLWSIGPFVIIVLLTAALLVPNALYAFRRFLVEHNLLWLVTYFIFLIGFGHLVVHVTTRTMQIVQTAREIMDQPDIEVPKAGSHG